MSAEAINVSFFHLRIVGRIPWHLGPAMSLVSAAQRGLGIQMTGTLIVCHSGDISCHHRRRWDAAARDILAGSLFRKKQYHSRIRDIVWTFLAAV